MPTSRERTPPPQRAFHPPSEVQERILAAYRAARGSSTDARVHGFGDDDGNDSLSTVSALERRIEANRVSNEMQMYMQQQQIKMEQQQIARLQEQLENQRRLINMSFDCLLFLLGGGTL